MCQGQETYERRVRTCASRVSSQSDLLGSLVSLLYLSLPVGEPVSADQMRTVLTLLGGRGWGGATEGRISRVTEELGRPFFFVQV